MIEYNAMLQVETMNVFLFVILSMIVSIAIDVLFGELPTKVHPVVIMGSIIGFFKGMFIRIKNRLSGLLLVLSACLCVGLILYVLYLIFSINGILLFVFFSVMLSATFSISMLLNTAIDVKADLDESIEKARKSVSYLVSRSTDELTESFIVSAVIESLTENITDSYVAPMFYYTVFAIVIMISPFKNQLYWLLLVPMLYRLFNTMDAMLGYTTDELKDIGFFPAKIDDLVNFIPSRIAGIYVVISAYLLKLNGKKSYEIMKRDARNCPSPNSGYTMATTAGALDIQLIKKDTYVLGDANREIGKDDITRAVSLSRMAITLFTLTIIILLTLTYVIL